MEFSIGDLPLAIDLATTAPKFITQFNQKIKSKMELIIMNYTQLEMGTGRNIYLYAMKVKRSLTYALFIIFGCVVVYLAAENYPMNV